MTEQDWLTSDEPARLMAFARTNRGDERAGAVYPATTLPAPFVVSDRKLGLFVEACRGLVNERDKIPTIWLSIEAAVLDDCVNTWTATDRWDRVVTKTERATLIRELLGNPFQPAPVYWTEGMPYSPVGRIVPYPKAMASGVTLIRGESMYRVCRWLTDPVVRIANAIFDQCDFGLMPILADALEEVGCTDASILEHCRGTAKCLKCHGSGHDVVRYPGGSYLAKCMRCGEVGPSEKGSGYEPAGPHVRGCWVLDLVLGND